MLKVIKVGTKVEIDKRIDGIITRIQFGANGGAMYNVSYTDPNFSYIEIWIYECEITSSLKEDDYFILDGFMA